MLLLEFWVKHGSNAGHLIKHFLLSCQLKLWKSVHNQMYYPKLWLALLVTNVHNMVSDPPTPTKNDMILFSGVLEVACHGWRSRLCDDTDCKLCSNDQETPFHLCKDCPFTKEVWGILKAVQLTSRETTFDPARNLALVPVFFALGTRETFSPGL